MSVSGRSRRFDCVPPTSLAPVNGHRQVGPAGPFRANNGSRGSRLDVLCSVSGPRQAVTACPRSLPEPDRPCGASGLASIENRRHVWPGGLVVETRGHQRHLGDEPQPGSRHHLKTSWLRVGSRKPGPPNGAAFRLEPEGVVGLRDAVAKKGDPGRVAVTRPRCSTTDAAFSPIASRNSPLRSNPWIWWQISCKRSRPRPSQDGPPCPESVVRAACPGRSTLARGYENRA